jgi:hypothetical protein
VWAVVAVMVIVAVVAGAYRIGWERGVFDGYGFSRSLRRLGNRMAGCWLAERHGERFPEVRAWFEAGCDGSVVADDEGAK